jgi:hypothetical protein
VVRRVDALGLPSYTGFVMPALEPEFDRAGDICDIRVSYPCDFAAQMLLYSARYCLRPVPQVGPAEFFARPLSEASVQSGDADRPAAGASSPGWRGSPEP